MDDDYLYDSYDDSLDEYRSQLDDLEDLLDDAKLNFQMEMEEEMNARIIAARKEEQAAYDDFIASLDMND